ncbi:MAG: bifunctional UDP-4-keto-pentose/UDP-xylose synthase [Pseudomonadota bacterium]
MAKKILILGVNGFIGNSLSEALLKKTDAEIFGMDMNNDKLENCLQHPKFHFTEGDITINKEWVEYHIKRCDVLLPLVAIATPATYVTHPLSIFELDFEANLDIIKKAVKYKRRVIFPSTSEVYGMCPEPEFNEETSALVTGPINKPRWIYSTSKQLMDRVIFAYGMQHDFQYSLFRPFNWVGPKLDDILNPKAGGSRVLTQFIGNILRGEDIKLVDGGEQRRCFTYIDDGVDALLRIIENKDGNANQRIFNVGNPKNDYSIRELAEMLVKIIKTYPKYAKQAEKTKIINVSSAEYYGKGYQDVPSRVPSVENAEKYLGWKPTTDMETLLRNTLDFYLK